MRKREWNEAPIVAILLWPESSIEIAQKVLPKYFLKMGPENLMQRPLNVLFGESILGVKHLVCREKSSSSKEMAGAEKEITTVNT